MKSNHRSRRGAISVLAAFLMIVLIAAVAFCVDLGYVFTAKEELQRTADATALAACGELAQQLSAGQSADGAVLLARAAASSYASHNAVTNAPLNLGSNASNDPGGDLVFGYISDLDAGAANFQTGNANIYNAVQVKVRKDTTLNGEVPYFFARVLGLEGQLLSAGATAAIVRDVGGFQVPADGSNLDILPFALDAQTWNALAAGQGNDDWSYDPQSKQVSPGSDGKLEVNLYPQGTGAPGNRGTVDVGSGNNSTCDISRQILDGISPQDLQALADSGHSLQFDANGELVLNGDTGISAGVSNELQSIVGQPRIVPVFSQVQGPGNNAQYTIVKWCGIRIVDVKLTGPMSKKHVTIQTAPIQAKGVIPSSEVGTSAYVYSNVVLVR